MATETTRWPFLLTAGDVITHNPHHPDLDGEWRVTGHPHYDHGRTIVTCEDRNGGEGVITYEDAEQATIRAHRTYSAPALYTDHQRCEAFRATTGRERAFLVGQFITRYGELFDAAYTQLQTARAADAACLRDEIAS